MSSARKDLDLMWKLDGKSVEDIWNLIVWLGNRGVGTGLRDGVVMGWTLSCEAHGTNDRTDKVLNLPKPRNFETQEVVTYRAKIEQHMHLIDRYRSSRSETAPFFNHR